VSGDIEQLTEQVRAGLAADEETARAATAGPWQSRRRGDRFVVLGGAHPLPGAESDVRVVHRDGGYPADWPKDVVNAEADADHIARHDPERVLARVAATRALLDEILAWEHGVDEDGDPCPRRGTTARCQCGRDARVLGLLRHLAQPYQTSQETT
jgi:hypothetical protein